MPLLETGQRLLHVVRDAGGGGGTDPALVVKDGQPGRGIAPFFGEEAAGQFDQAVPVFFLDDELVDAADGPQNLVEMLEALFSLKFVEGDFNGGVQFPVFKRLQEIPIGLGDLGSSQGLGVGIGGKKNHRQVKPAAQALGRLDAVHAPFQQDVHEHEIRAPGLGEFQGLLPGGHRTCHLVAQVLQSFLDSLGNQPFVFYYQNYGAGHAIAPEHHAGVSMKCRAVGSLRSAPPLFSGKGEGRPGDEFPEFWRHF